MWAALLMRILRKRIVLAIIFALSLTYCVLSFWQESSTESLSNDIDSDSSSKKLSNSFLWHSDSESNQTNVKVVTCRNSVQGKVLIVDDKGYICSRSDVLSSGCCNTNSENTKRFACDTCKDTGCCSIYEYCISCCLHPDKKHVLQSVLGKASENVLFASVTDHFELCLAKCRTSSQSVHHENSYRDPRAKHCYGETPQLEAVQSSLNENMVATNMPRYDEFCIFRNRANGGDVKKETKMSERQPLHMQDDYGISFLEPCLRCWQGSMYWKFCQLKPWPSSLRRRRWILMGTVAGIIFLVVAGLIIYYVGFASDTDSDDSKLDPPDPIVKPPPSNSILGNYRNAAVVTNGYLCAEIGRDVLRENGTAVDGAIAALICEGVIALQSMGIGGGFFMTIYDRKSGTAKILNARETAPALSHENMYSNNPVFSEIGGLSVAVPGELRGYKEAYDKYGGKVPWKRLFEPSIKICREGFQVFPYLANLIQRNEITIRASPGLSEILINNATNQILKEGDLLKRPKLADTLQIIADKGVEAFYNGELTNTIVKEIQEDGGIITKEDLKNYKVQWLDPVECDVGPYHMFSVPVPGSGEIVSFIMNVLDQSFITGVPENVVNQRIVEAFKYAYGKRTVLGDISDPSFVPNITEVLNVIKNLTSKSYADEIRSRIEDDKTYQDPKHYGANFSIPEDHGTAHLNVLAPNGDAVSATSTVNLLFGSKFVSKKLGIIWNNEMNDFSIPNVTNAFGVPPSPANFIKPGKRPMSSMCPSIFIDKDKNVQLVAGSAGGTRITTSTVLVALNNLVFKKNIKESIDERRFHHQLAPMAIDYEYGFLAQNVKALKDIGHKTARLSTPASFVTGIAKLNGNVTACYDFRRYGSVAGF